MTCRTVFALWHIKRVSMIAGWVAPRLEFDPCGPDSTSMIAAWFGHASVVNDFLLQRVSRVSHGCFGPGVVPALIHMHLRVAFERSRHERLMCVFSRDTVCPCIRRTDMPNVVQAWKVCALRWRVVLLLRLQLSTSVDLYSKSLEYLYISENNWGKNSVRGMKPSAKKTERPELHRRKFEKYKVIGGNFV